jgi:hypothetical protein
MRKYQKRFNACKAAMDAKIKAGIQLGIWRPVALSHTLLEAGAR